MNARRCLMAVMEVAGRKISLDDEGYLENPNDWDEKVACALAEQEGVEELTAARMDIIRFLREHYMKFNFFPLLGSICKNVHQTKT
jgi:dissimilatory sulfite reductase related protein